MLAAHAADNPLDNPPANLARTGAYEAGHAAEAGEAVGAVVAGRYKLLEATARGAWVPCTWLSRPSPSSGSWR